MILVADSGSTKCDWIAIDAQGNQQHTNTMGFNPFFHTTELVAQKLSENEFFNKTKDSTKIKYKAYKAPPTPGPG